MQIHSCDYGAGLAKREGAGDAVFKDASGDALRSAQKLFRSSCESMTAYQPRKSVVAAFDAAAKTYDHLTQVQREVAQQLVERAARAMPAAPQTILDLGCGTGHVVARAQGIWPQAEIIALDAAPAMLARLRKKFPDVKALCCDARHLDGIGRYDLILSNMVLHWLENPRRVLTHWRRFLNPGGRLLVALPIAGSLGEWRELTREAQLPDGLWTFPLEDFAADLCIHAEVCEFPSTHPELSSFLLSLKGSGAYQSRPGYKPASTAAMRRLLHMRRGPITVTFRILFLTLGATAG
jgi:malonyl-CoA O-methyltransferase